MNNDTIRRTENLDTALLTVLDALENLPPKIENLQRRLANGKNITSTESVYQS